MHVMHMRSLSAVDLNLMLALHALLTERNVTRASARLSLSQSATSHALARLRELYGDPLLDISDLVLKKMGVAGKTPGNGTGN